MSEPFLHQIIAIAKAAGQGIMTVYNQPGGEIVLKADQSPLTEADLLSNRIIVDGLARLTPDIPVLSEESAEIPYQQRAAWQRFWLVDPLDGTKEFIKRNGEFTVNIALVEQGRPILGVVHAPALDVCYAGAAGTGAFVERGQHRAKPIQVCLRSAQDTLKIVASRSHRDARTTALLDHLGPHECITMGSSLKFCLVAEGSAHFYPRLGPTMEWDTAAAHAVVDAAGGKVCDLSGTPLRYNKADLHNPEFFVLADTDRALLSAVQNCL
ncbi:3'(2'),5'-bisphosphate nucleotidase CysQ [Candidatus Methylomicrobium oryzae]|uniref:3'(2'),5'-bisphosphate nucleotidase CysQ n=1 Tax=Candidatus Methylomicrobium oryzae TaxID=2802053 RepID=UPI00192339A5|nr:3'(2'),5'-bisphosphate nucleotidase CysQ [Methylomicrobium sp. RS1]